MAGTLTPVFPTSRRSCFIRRSSWSLQQSRALLRHQDAAQVPPAARPDRPSIPLGNLVFAAHYRPMATRNWAVAFGIWCRSFDRQPIIAYGAALACMALALALRAALELVDSNIVPFATLYPALMAAALLGGFGPGMVALLIGVLGAWWILLPSPGQLLPLSSSQAA